MPLLMVVVLPVFMVVLTWCPAASLGFLALLGAIGAKAGGANVLRATARVTFWGALAMALTAGVGKLFGTGSLEAEPARADVTLGSDKHRPRLSEIADRCPVSQILQRSSSLRRGSSIQIATWSAIGT